MSMINAESTLSQAIVEAGLDRLDAAGLDLYGFFDANPAMGALTCLLVGAATLEKDGWQLVRPDPAGDDDDR